MDIVTFLRIVWIVSILILVYVRSILYQYIFDAQTCGYVIQPRIISCMATPCWFWANENGKLKKHSAFHQIKTSVAMTQIWHLSNIFFEVWHTIRSIAKKDWKGFIDESTFNRLSVLHKITKKLLNFKLRLSMHTRKILY